MDIAAQESSLFPPILFWVFAIMAVGSALGVILHRSIIYAALFLIVVFMSIAGVFVLNNADFLAVAQVVVYAVGMTIIMLFGIMFTGEQLAVQKVVNPRRLFAYALTGLMTLGALVAAVAFYQFRTVTILPTGTTAGLYQRLVTEGSTRMLSEELFGTYVLPFEIVSILLLMAMIGAIVLAKKKFSDTDEMSLKYNLDAASELRPEATVWRERVIAGYPSDDAQAQEQSVGDDSVSESQEEAVGAKS